MPYSILHLSLRSPQFSKGFTLVEMIMVIVITGIIGGMVAVFIQMPVQQYVDAGRRAELTDIADTALRRMSRDIRTALPNSVRVTGTCSGASSCFIEFLPINGSGRYRSGAGGTNDILDFTIADTSFEVLGPMPSAVGGDSVVVYNTTYDPLDTNSNAYVGGNRTAYGSTVGAVMYITSKRFPLDSPGHRFYIISTPVTYVCAPATDGAGNGTGTLTRWQGYAIQPGQPIMLPATGTPSSALLASKVSTCSFSYGAVGQSLALVTMNLGITDSGEPVTLYNATHVSNVP